MLTILHAADLHLDSPFRALPAQQAQARRAGQREALEGLRDLVLEHHVDLVLLPGDLFDSQQVYPETVEALTRALAQMPCPVVIAPGNHDPYTQSSPYAQPIWPDNVFIFTSEAVTSFAFPALGVTVYGCAFTGPFRDTDPLAGFCAAEDGTLALGCFHADVAAKSSYAPVAQESLAASGLAYVALGHVHDRSPLSGGKTLWAYSGCLQGRGFDELGDKGACLVTVPDAGPLRLDFLPLPGPRYWEIEVAPDTLDAALAGYENDYVRCTLVGEADPPDLAALQALGDSRCRLFQLIDRTVPPVDVWSRIEENTLTGHFLRQMRTRLDAAPPQDRPTLEAALRYGLAALEGREEPR